MKRFKFQWLILSFMLWGALQSCSDGDGNNGDALSEALTFVPAFLEVSDDATTATIDLQWSNTSWNIEVEEGEIVQSVAPLQGGSNASSGTTTLTLTLNPNQGEERRAQDLLARDGLGRVRRFVLTQRRFSQWQTVAVDPATRYQQVEGFGGMYNPYIWTPSNLVSNSEIDKLYGETGLGYNIMRLMIYSDKSAWSKDVSGAQRAQKKGAIVFACPWDCKDAWADSVTVGNSRRKHLLPAHYADYANHLCDFITYMKGRGVTIYGITVQNEPDGSFVYWTASELATFIKTYGAQIRAKGVKLMSPEPEGVNINYISTITNDAEAMAQIDLVATHTYTGFIDEADNGSAKRNFLANLYLTQLQPAGKGWWMTEHLFNDGSNASYPSEMLFQQWSYNLTHLAREIHDCMTSYAGAYVYWYLKRYYGLLGDNDDLSPVGNGEITKNGYILGHYAGYAAGSVRIGAESPTEELTVTAYEQSSVLTTVVLTNYGTESLPVKVTGTSATCAEAVTTTESANMQALTVKAEEGEVLLTLPPQSITSVKCYNY